METVEKQNPVFPQFPQLIQRHVQFVFLNQKPDISTLVKTGHFYFGWTHHKWGLDLES